MLSINAVKGFEYGSGFKGVEMFGSKHNDKFQINNGKNAEDICLEFQQMVDKHKHFKKQLIDAKQ